MLTARQQEIVDESIKLISESGIQELTIKNIAGRIGVSEPALYRHFTNKLEILMAILDFFEQNAKRFFSQIDKSKGAIDCVGQIFINRCVEFSKKPYLATVVFSEEIFRNEKELAQKVSRIMRMNHGAILEYIKQAIANGEAREDIDVNHLCHIILGSLRLLITKWRMSEYGFDLEIEAKKIWESLMVLIVKK